MPGHCIYSLETRYLLLLLLLPSSLTLKLHHLKPPYLFAATKKNRNGETYLHLQSTHKGTNYYLGPFMLGFNILLPFCLVKKKKIKIFSPLFHLRSVTRPEILSITENGILELPHFL